ncbi:YaeQ family protein [Azospira restricta]|uniref:YaeQ family protein n=1 Tax=Azospira restricta TaxID=404405 RepID=A0A974PX68_9RHOO|nr:YaeQ family protein [Azospira restricta]QRJ62645.1 YaeQ family protein [Azospira restricta]
MALKSTVFKADLQVSDLDRHHYQSYPLTLARHPSETDERLMVRLLAFALFASDGLSFGRGLSTEDEPALFEPDLTGAIRRWIDVGLPDERDLRRACGRADEVVVLVYGGRAADIWWQQNEGKLKALDKLSVLALEAADSAALATLAGRTMRLQCTIQDGRIYLADEATTLEFEPRWLKRAA